MLQTHHALTPQALKEWQVAVDALERGETILLLRKGGIRDGRFRVPHDRVWLYPTYEHQQPHLLKPEFAAKIQPMPSERVRIGAWATLTATTVSDPDRLADLLPYHIWQPAFVSERLKWQPTQPLTVLLLRVYRLQPARSLSLDPRYGGCKSWIELAEPLPLDDQSPVLSDAAYAGQVQQIATALQVELA